MGDRTYAHIVINHAFRELAEFVFAECNERFNDVIEAEGGVCYIDHQANYGNLPEFEQALEAQFIPYDKRWEEGGEYGAGDKHVRVVVAPNGDLSLKIKESYDKSDLMSAHEVLHLIELGNIENWEALRSAASTFIFTADPELNRDAYRSIFNMREGEMETIRGLIPKKEFYLIQRDLNISKKCILSVEPEQYVLSTSSPAEQALYFDNVERYGFDTGVMNTMAALSNSRGT